MLSRNKELQNLVLIKATYLFFNAEMHNIALIAEAIMHEIFSGTEETKNDTIRSINTSIVIKYADMSLVRRKINPNNIVIKANKIIIATAEISTIAIRLYLVSYANANE